MCRSDLGSLDVINMEGSTYDRISYGEMASELPKRRKFGVNPIRYPEVHMGLSYMYYWLGTVFCVLPYGLAVDFLLHVTGQKTRSGFVVHFYNPFTSIRIQETFYSLQHTACFFRLMAMYRKVFYSNSALAYFLCKEFPIETKTCLLLDGALSPNERPSFSLTVGEEAGLPYVS